MEYLVKEKKTFDANLINLYPMLIWIRERISKFFNQRDLEKIELASEEVIVNIITHGYKKEKGKIALDILVNKDLILTFKDNAKKFNPLLKKKKKLPKSVLKKPGGLGIFIIFDSVDEIEYMRKDLKNILILKKKRNLSY